MENILLISILLITLVYLFIRIKKNLIEGEPGENCAHCGKLQLKKQLARRQKS